MRCWGILLLALVAVAQARLPERVLSESGSWLTPLLDLVEEVVDSGSDITLLFPGVNGTDSSGPGSTAGWTPLDLGTEEINNYILPGKFESVEDLLDAGTITSAAGSAVTFRKGSKGDGEGAVLAEFVINGTSRTYLVDPKPEEKTITVFKLNGGDVSRFCVEFYLEDSSGYDGQFELGVSGVDQGAWVGGEGPLAMEGELFSGGEHSYRCWDLSSYSKTDPAFTLTVKPLGEGKDALKLEDEAYSYTWPTDEADWWEFFYEADQETNDDAGFWYIDGRWCRDPLDYECEPTEVVY